MKNLKGLGLLESLLALTIIAVVLLLSVRYYSKAQQNNKINASVLMSQNIHSAMVKCLRNKGNCSSIDSLISQNYLSAGAKQSPWQSRDSNSLSLQTFTSSKVMSGVCNGSKITLNAGVYILVSVAGFPKNQACCQSALRLRASTDFADCNSEQNTLQTYFLYS